MDLPGSTTNLGEGELDTPDLTLVPETVLADELQLGVPISQAQLASLLLYLLRRSLDMNSTRARRLRHDRAFSGREEVRTDEPTRRVDAGPCRSLSNSWGPSRR